MKITTRYNPPPVPFRNCDWSAVDDDDMGETRVGYGATEEEAIADIMDQLGGNDDKNTP